MSDQALENLKQAQTPHIAGTHPAPFLSDPAHFRSGRGPAEIESAQAGQLIAVPEPKRSPPVMDLAEVIGSAAVTQVQNNGQIVFHTAGDTGTGQHEDLGQVANVMSMDYHRPNPADRPSFFLHLGDVTYNLVFGRVESKTALYQPQFYLPYSNYPGKILAIPGNHDSNP
jgi:Calcineurin-like phosphoesterase